MLGFTTRSLSFRAVHAAVLVGGCVWLQAGASLAAQSTFVTGSAAWSTAGNWNNGVPTSSDIAVFSQGNATTIATLSANTSVAGLRFTNTGSTSFESNGSGRFILSIGSSGVTVDPGAGNVQIGNNASQNQRVGLSITTSQTWTNNSTSAVVFKEQGAMTGAPVTNLNASTLTLAGPGNFKFAGNIAGSGGITMAGTGLLTLLSTATNTGPTVISSGTVMLGEATGNGSVLGTITNNGTLVFNRSGSVTANSITGSGAVGISGSAGSIVTFAGTNSYTYSGGTRILSPATLAISSTASLPRWNQAGGFQVDPGGTLAVSGSVTGGDVATLLGTGNFQAGSTISVDTASGSITFSGSVGNGVNLTKAGANTLVLAGANTPGSTTIGGGGTLQVGTGGTAGSLSGPVTNSGTLTFNRSDDVTFGDVVSGGGAIVKLGAGKLTLSASNTYTGNTYVNNGTFEVAGLGSSAASIYLSDNDETAVFRFIGGGNLSLGQQVQVGNVATGTGGGVIRNDGAGTLTFTNAAFSNTFGGATAARSLTLGGTNAGANRINGVIADNNAAAGGVLALAKNDSGTWILGGANTYTGPTSINGGTLVVDGSLATGAVTVASAATLAGSGTLGGAVGVLAGGIVGPGNSGPGTLTVNNAFVLDGSSALAYDLDPATTTAGGGINDLITGVTNLTLGGVLNISGTGDWTTLTDNTSWRLFNYSGALTNNTLALGTTPSLGGGRSFAIDTSTPGQVNVYIVPEPAALAVVAGIMAVAAASMTRLRRAGRGSRGHRPAARFDE